MTTLVVVLVVAVNRFDTDTRSPNLLRKPTNKIYAPILSHLFAADEPPAP